MTLEKDDKSSTRPLNTSAQIQQIFSEVQLQLPSVNFDNDNDDTNDLNDEILESDNPETTEALLESLSTNHANSFLMLHSNPETLQQPPSVESQMRVSPNLFDNSPPKPSFLSMDLFNTIDFDKLPSSISNSDLPEHSIVTRTFHRQRPTNHHNLSSQQQTNTKNRDDRQILERLAQQANRFHTHERSNPPREQHSFKNLESALFGPSREHFDRHEKQTGVPESERKTIYLDLRNSNVQQQEKPRDEQQSTNMITSIPQQIPSSESESDDDDGDDNDRNDGMLWFEKRRQVKREQQLKPTES